MEKFSRKTCQNRRCPTVKEQVLGLKSLISNPYLFKRIIVRELFHRRRYYDKKSWTEWQIYDAYISMPQHGSKESCMRPLNVFRIKTISDIVNKLGVGLKVLDVGCGDGSIGRSLLKTGHQVVSIELPKVAFLAKKGFGVTSLIACDAEMLPFRCEVFDVVVAAELLEHLWNPYAFVKEAHRVLKTSGHFIVSGLEGPEALRYDTHKQYFDVEGLESMLKGLFALNTVKRLGPLGAPTYTIVASFCKV